MAENNLQDGKHYKFLDFPELPDHLVQLCINRLSEKEHFLFELGRDANKKIYNMLYNGTHLKKQQCIFEVFEAPIEVRQWLFDNKIIKDVFSVDVSVQRSYGGNALLPHIDKTVDSNDGIVRIRNVALNYLLTDSGPRTCFYNSNKIDDICESVIVPKYKWHILEVKRFHGVENIESDRISLTITINKD
jgi:hypothetical protein